MKNIGKTVALVLALMILAATFSLVFALEKTKGERLQELKIILGSDGGALNEEDELTRAEAATVITRVLLLTMKDDKNCKYIDVNGSWAAPYVNALLEANITVGISDTEFGMNNKISKYQFYVWLYRALNGGTKENLSEDVYNKPQLLVDNGLLTKEELAELLEDKASPTKRGDIFNISFDTMANNDTLINKHIDAGIFTEEQAIAVGMTKEAVENKIIAIEAMNFNEVLVTWRKSASIDKDCYRINDELVQLESLNKTQVILSFVDQTELLEKQDTAEVKFDADKDFIKPDYQGTTNEVFDITPPTVAAVKQTGVDKLTIYFSEYVLASSITSTLNNGLYFMRKTGTTDMYVKSIEYIVPSHLTDNTSYLVTVNNNVEDTSGLVMKNSVSLEFIYQTVKKPIEVTVKEATTNRLVLALSAETIKTKTVGEIEEKNFTYIFANRAVTTVTVNGTEIVLDLSEYPAPENSDGWDLFIHDADKMFVDEWGNTVESKDICLKFYPFVDRVAPTVTKFEFNDAQTQMKITFDERILPDYDVVIMQNSETVTDRIISARVLSDDSKQITLTTVAEEFDDAMYSVIVKNVKDNMGNAMEDYTQRVIAKTMRPVTVENIQYIVEADKAVKFYVTFNNSMNDELLNIENWSIVNAAIKAISFKSGTRDVIEVDFLTPMTATEADDAVTLCFSNEITSINGNTFAGVGPFSTTITVDSKDTYELKGADVFERFVFETIDGNTIKLTTVDDIDISTLNSSVFTIRNNEALLAERYTATVIHISDAILNENNSVSYILNTSLFFKTGSNTIFDSIDDSGKVNGKALFVAVDGIRTADGIYVQGEKAAKDCITPIVSSTIVAAQEDKDIMVTVEFSEKINSATPVYIANELTVKYDSKVLIAGIDYMTDIRDGNLHIVILDKSKADDKLIEIYLSKTSLYMMDLAGNVVKEFSVVGK